MLLYILLFVSAVIISPAFSNIIYTLRQNISSDNIPCEKDWYYFSDKCYKALGQKLSDRLSWENAKNRCKELGGNLVSIKSQEEQDFIVAFLQLDVQLRVWIGLHDTQYESTYMWSDDSPFGYSNWREGEPTGNKYGNEDCVIMIFDPWTGNLGKWNDFPCSYEEGYICKKHTTSRKEFPDQKYCSSEEGGGLKRKSSCFHVITQIDSWQNAEAHCKDTFNGHLVSIHDTLDDIFLDYVLKSIAEEAWIGIKIQEQFQQRWTTGLHVTYNGFSEQSNFSEGDCVARKKRNEWITVPCSTQLSFVCEVSTVMPYSDGGTEFSCPSSAVHKVLIGVFLCVILLAILMGVVLYYFRPCGFEFFRTSSKVYKEHSSASESQTMRL